MRSVIPDGSGQVGHILARRLQAAGHDVTLRKTAGRSTTRAFEAPNYSTKFGATPRTPKGLQKIGSKQTERPHIIESKQNPDRGALRAEGTSLIFSQPGKVAIQSVVTFSPDRGGVFDVFLGLVRHGLGGAQGPGTQFVSRSLSSGYTKWIWCTQSICSSHGRTSWASSISRRPTQSPTAISCALRRVFPEWPAAARELVLRWRQNQNLD